MKVTGKQLTVMVVAVAAAAILTPAAVYASTGSSVNITDPVTASSKARVVSGKLAVGDGSGALTVDGTVRVGDGSGALTVDGRVDTDPASAWSASGLIANNGTDQVLLRDLPAGAGASLGSLTISHFSGSGATSVRLRTFAPTTAGSCAGGGTVQQEVVQLSLPQDDTKTITWAPRFKVSKQSAESCLVAFVFGGSGTHEVSVTATGALY